MDDVKDLPGFLDALPTDGRDMMAELLFCPGLWYGAVAAAVAFAALAVFAPRRSPLWALLSGLSMAAGILLALLQGRLLGDMLPAVLAAAAIALAGLCWRGDRE